MQQYTGLGQHKDVGEKPTVILFIQINHHAGTPKHNNYKRHDKLGYSCCTVLLYFFKKNLNASRPSEHPSIRGGEIMPKRLGAWIIGFITKPLGGI